MKNSLKLLISLFVVGFILYKLDYQAVWDTMWTANLGLLMAALGMQLVSQTLAAYRWYLIMRMLHFPFPFPFYLKSYFKGSLFNQVLPTSVGGDAYRIAEVSSYDQSVKESFFGVFIDRVVGLVGLLILNFVAISYQPNLFPEEVYWAINIIIVAALFGLFVLMAVHKFERFRAYRITRFFYDLSDRFRFIYKTPRNIGIQVGLSVLIHLTSMAAIFGIGHALLINESLITYLALVPPAILLTLIPISFAGWGIREGALIAFFLMIGTDETKVLAMSLLYGIILIIAALPGLAFFLQSKKYL